MHSDLSPDRVRGLAAELRTRLQQRAARYGGRLALDDGETFVLVLPEVDAALAVGLDLTGLSPAVGLGYGPLELDEAGRIYGADSARVRAIAWRSPAGTVHCTPSFLAVLQVPPGIGIHRAGGPIAAAIGCAVHQVVDQRPDGRDPSR